VPLLGGRRELESLYKRVGEQTVLRLVQRIHNAREEPVSQHWRWLRNPAT
jgi:hypothetical protein